MPRSSQHLAVASLGTLVTLVTFTAPLATLNSIATDLGAGPAGRTWVLSSMSIGLGAALLSTGTIADDFGRRRTFVAGLVVLAAGSALAALSPDVVVFVLCRVLQGVGGAAVLASSLGLIAATYPAGPRRAAASGVWGASVGAGIAVGPVLAAWLDRLHGWRDVYVLILAAALVLAVVARLLVAESRSAEERPLDLPGVALLAGGMSALLAALVEGRQGWLGPGALLLGAASVLLLAGFVLVERRSAHPMLNLGLFRQPAFVAATVAALTTGAGVIALMSYLSGFLVLVLGLTALEAASLMLLWAVTSVVTALLARCLPAGVSGRVQLAVGLLGVAVGQLAMLGVRAGTTWVHFVPGLLVAGVASGVLNAALGREAVASVPPGRGSLGSGANNTARYVGSAVGVTVVSVVAAGSTGTAALVSGWNQAVLVTAPAMTVLGAVVVLVSRSRRTAR